MDGNERVIEDMGRLGGNDLKNSPQELSLTLTFP